MSFRRRNFNEVLDNLLTNIVGGVASESHPFPPTEDAVAPFSHPLEKPTARSVLSVYGVRNGQSTQFSADNDYTLDENGQHVQWLEGAQLPDKGSLLAINYLPTDSVYDYKDLYVGSVTRTLTEAVGLEIAQLYAQLEGVYRAGFINTAEASALDHVVSLLGIQRVRAGRFQTEIEFTRVNGGHGDIYIPTGTRILNSDGSVEYETTATITMADGQNTVRANARDREENPVGLEANTLTVLAKPIAGIASVNNPAPTTLSNRFESDSELKTRAKHFLHGSERATLGSLQEAVRLQGIQAELLEEEALDTAGNMRKTGVVRVVPQVETLTPDQRQRILTAIEQVRPAGVTVLLSTDVEPPINVNLSLRVVTANGLLEQDIRAAHDAVRKKLSDYFQQLPIKEPGSVNKLIGLVLSVPEVQDLDIVSAQASTNGVIAPLDLSLGQLGVANQTTRLGDVVLVDTNLPTHLRINLRHPDTQLPSESEIEQAFHQAIASLNASSAAGTPLINELSRELLLYLLPLPIPPTDKAQGTVASFSPGSGANDTELGAFEVDFLFTDNSGLGHIVQADGDVYSLAEFEQLSLASVELVAVTTNE